MAGYRKTVSFWRSLCKLALAVLICVGTAQAVATEKNGLSVRYQFAGHPGMSAEEHKKIEENWGIRVEGLRLTAGGYNLDFRYNVTDVEKASPLHDVKLKPYIYDSKTKARMRVHASPRLGTMKQNRKKPKLGRSYFIMFGNPARYLKRGTKVSLTIGDMTIDEIAVQ